MKKIKFRGKSGKIYIKNNSSSENHYYSVYSKEPLLLSNWIGTATREQALKDSDNKPIEVKNQIEIITPDNRYKYTVNRFGETDNKMDITDIILGLQERHGFENVKINR
jgi:hypothetical protein